MAFSDDESPPEKNKKDVKPAPKEQNKTETHNYPENEPKMWGNRAPIAINRRSAEEDELNALQYQQKVEVNRAVERAKQRKEEEEKKYNEQKQNTIKMKLQALDERQNKSKRDDLDDFQGTINPSTVPPQPITPAPIPVPDWERDKERPRHANDYESEKKQSVRDNSSFDFKQMTQIEGKNFSRKESRGFDRDNRNFYKHNLPPRLARQQYMNNSSGTPQTQGNAPFHNQYDSRWGQGNQNSMPKSSPPQGGRKRDDDIRDRDMDERRDFRRQGSDESYRSTGRYSSESGRKSADNRYKEEEDRDYYHHRDRDDDKDKFDKHGKKDSYDMRHSNDDLHERPGKQFNRRGGDDKMSMGDRYERPQRPDSRDSRTSRHSRESARDSEPREYMGGWADPPYESNYEEKKKDSLHYKEDRRQVPGPITKERIEQDDLKNEKRNLTQLKRGQMPEKKIAPKDEEKLVEKEVEDAWSMRKKETVQDPIGTSKAWADSVPTTESISDKYSYSESPPKDQKLDEDSRKDLKEKDDKNRHGGNRNRSNWNTGPGMTIRNSWGSNSSSNNKRNWGGAGGGRSSRTGPPRPSSVKSGEFHGTDSEISADEMSASIENKDELSRRSPKPNMKSDKDEKNKEQVKHDKNQDKYSHDKHEKFMHDVNTRDKDTHNKKDYVPRGEPSRHGRGGNAFRGGRGGLSKRIDGYGPPPSKSPFGHHDDKDRKLMDENQDFTSSDEKSKQNLPKKDAHPNAGQQKKNDEKFDRKNKRGPDTRRGKPRNKDDACETASDNSEEDGKRRQGSSNKLTGGTRPGSNQSANASRRNNPPRMNDKRNYNGPPRGEQQTTRQNSSGNLRPNQKKDGQKDDKDVNYISNAISDISLKNRDNEMENVSIFSTTMM